MASAQFTLPPEVQEDITRAAALLKAEGCSEVYLFGSWTSANATPESDIDLAVRGCPPARFFHLMGRLMSELRHPVDLVMLDRGDPFAAYLDQTGGLVRIA